MSEPVQSILIDTLFTGAFVFFRLQIQENRKNTRICLRTLSNGISEPNAPATVTSVNGALTAGVPKDEIDFICSLLKRNAVLSSSAEEKDADSTIDDLVPLVVAALSTFLAPLADDPNAVTLETVSCDHQLLSSICPDDVIDFEMVSDNDWYHNWI